ncbi:uncharacterized protein [Drosophila bipectinata]|uniref:uncharacterized protein n=1 Tax=Drosophila bipectinata TaxID=42026 RepID=UPI001C89C212|nr:uncharacterized protein LOC108119140 [Drosophila bipectinata]
MTCFLSRMLGVGRCARQALNRWLCHLDHCLLALATLDLLCVVCLLHYQLVWHGRDLFYWCDELDRRFVEYLLSAIVLMGSVSVLGSCVDAVLFSALIRRQMSRYNLPRQHFEERYRRFVFLRLVKQLEQALKVQAQQETKDKELEPFEHLSMAQKLIREAIDEFRTSVRILLWPNRSDLQAEPFVLFHISDSQLVELSGLGYRLGDVEGQDVVNTRLSNLLNPPWY